MKCQILFSGKSIHLSSAEFSLGVLKSDQTFSHGINMLPCMCLLRRGDNTVFTVHQIDPSAYPSITFWFLLLIT